MFRNLLVPLDGSRLAESVLPWTLWIAERFGSAVTLLHVLERGAPERVHGERHLADPEEAKRYLEDLASGFPERIAVSEHVHTAAEGDVPASIAQHAAELGADLTALCTHGASLTHGPLLGTIAQHVLRRAASPVLLLRPEMPATQHPGIERILVLLDGSREGEVVLPYVTALAERASAAVQVLIVVPTLSTVRGDRAAAARVSPLATAAALDVEQENAVEYAQSVVEELKSRGLRADAGVARGDVPRIAAETAARPEVSLVAMAGHGRSGIGALWASSIGSSIQSRLGKPMLLVNPATPRRD